MTQVMPSWVAPRSCAGIMSCSCAGQRVEKETCSGAQPGSLSPKPRKANYPHPHIAISAFCIAINSSMGTRPWLVSLACRSATTRPADAASRLRCKRQVGNPGG